MRISHKLIASILKAVCGFQVSIANLKSLLKYTLAVKKTTKICVPFKVSSTKTKTNPNRLKLELSGLPWWCSG